MFRSADVVAINKVDLLPHLDFDIDAFESNLHDVNPAAGQLRTSARTGDGVESDLRLVPLGRRDARTSTHSS